MFLWVVGAVVLGAVVAVVVHSIRGELSVVGAARDLAGRARGSYVERLDFTDLSIEMVYVPAGKFLMGTPMGEAGREHESEPAVREVRVDGFWVSRHEVTWELFQL